MLENGKMIFLLSLNKIRFFFFFFHYYYFLFFSLLVFLLLFNFFLQ